MTFLRTRSQKLHCQPSAPLTQTHWLEEDEDKWWIPPPGCRSQAESAILKDILIMAAPPQAGTAK